MTEESIQFHTGQTITSGPLRLSDLLRQDARRHIKQHDTALSKSCDDVLYRRQFCIVKERNPEYQARHVLGPNS